MNVDDVAFAAVQLGIAAIVIRCLFYEATFLYRGSGIRVGRGNESWQVFFATWGVLSVLVTQAVALYQPLSRVHVAVVSSILNTALLYWLCFRSTWFRNKIIGYWGKLKSQPERH